MRGQVKSFEEKEKMVEEYIEHAKPNEKHDTLKFDLRGYAKYLKNYGISGKDVPEDIVDQFRLK